MSMVYENKKTEGVWRNIVDLQIKKKNVRRKLKKFNGEKETWKMMSYSLRKV